MIWIVLMLIFIVAAITLYIVDIHISLPIISASLSIIMLICFFAVPIKGYMDVESTHWHWSVDIFTYQPVNESGRTGHKSFRSSAERAARENIPTGAYNININTHSGSKTVVDREWKDERGHTHKDTHTEHYYYATYSYTINQWVKTSDVSTFGRDKNPYEPERPYDTTAPDVLGNKKCGIGHNEEYKVTGYVNGEIITYSISKSDWEKIGDTDEFEYTKFRFGDEIWNLKLAR